MYNISLIHSSHSLALICEIQNFLLTWNYDYDRKYDQQERDRTENFLAFEMFIISWQKVFKTLVGIMYRA